METQLTRTSGPRSTALPRGAATGVSVARHTAWQARRVLVVHAAIPGSPQAIAERVRAWRQAIDIKLRTCALTPEELQEQKDKMQRMIVKLRQGLAVLHTRELLVLRPRVYNATAQILQRIRSIDDFRGSSTRTLAQAMSMDDDTEVVRMAGAMRRDCSGVVPVTMRELDEEVDLLLFMAESLPLLKQRLEWEYKLLTAYDSIKRAFPDRFCAAYGRIPLRLSTAYGRVKLAFPARFFKKKR